MATKITIPVEFKDSAQSYKQIISQLQEQLKRVKPGTALYDTIKQQISDAEKEIKKVDAKLDLGIISKSEMQSVSSFLTRVDALVRRASDSLKTVDISNLIDFSDTELFSGDQLKQVQKYRNEIEALAEKIQQVNSSKIKDVLGSKDKSKFTSKELDSGIVETYQSLTTELKGIEEQAETTTSKLDELRLSTAQAQREIIAYKKTNADALGTKLTASRVLGANKSESLQNIGKRLINEFSSLEGIWNNAGPDGGQAIAETILGHLGLKPDQIAKLVSNSYQDTIKRIQEDFGKASGDSSRIFRGADLKQAREDLQAKDILQKSNTLSTMEKNYEASRQEVQELRKQRNTLRATIGTLHEKVGILTSEMSVVDDDGSEVDVFRKLEEVQRELNKAIAEARKLRLTTGANSDQQGAAMDSNVAGMASGEAAFNAQQEADKFKENLKQAISHWLSAQMIITKVREGIHQAWVDIQGLDKAMTNIAVVTDMSVSDLWGKIDEYMAIAQEYGVTTQGVYEVSQLYYQQGLSTNEVMEATTETLKMARIAGMDYAEAADAMTVAIRAFKMEMSDAQVITDVYSKVAAVTASDSQELAIAMSKTASSAESVGSSFENTTAMLAVMIETTRESAQNLGSALKSIISRYGEMKTGLTVDSEGEAIDYNKVDTALQSVGISIKDAQGQFRDFDDVIFELSKKWDSLDKNTQRYIATIMAGNRQQSRFIALVDNWERLDEVSKAAYDSEDAGLLQYAKTLDSLETKLNALSTSFQQFYMNIVNGGFFKGVVDILTAMLNGLNKLGNWQAILNIVNLITSLRAVSSLLLNTFSNPLSEIAAQMRGHAEESVNIWADAGWRAGKGFANNLNAAVQQTDKVSPERKNSGYKNAWKNEKLGKGLTNTASIVSLLTTVIGSAVSKNNQKLGSHLSMVGTVASGASMGAAFGPWGMAAGALVGLAAGIPAILKAYDKNTQATNELTAIQEKTEKLNVERAEAKNDYTTLKNSIEKLKELDKTKYESDENYQSWIEANNQLVEAYPQFIGYIDEAGNTIADLTYSSDILAESFRLAAEANREYYISKVDEIQGQIDLNKGWEYKTKMMSRKEAEKLGIYDAIPTDAVSDNFFSFKGAWAHYLNRYNFGLGSQAQVTSVKTVEELYDKNIDYNKIIATPYEQLSEQEQLYFNKLKAHSAIIEENGKLIYETHFQAFLENEQQLQQLYGTKSAAMQSGVYLASLESALDDTIEGFENWTAFAVSLSQNTEKFKKLSFSELVNLDSVSYEELISPFINFYNNLKPFQQELLQNLMGDPSGYSYSEITSALEDFGLTSDNEIYKAYIQEWTKANYLAEQKIFEGIWGDTSDIQSYGQWIKDEGSKFESQEKRQEEYRKYVTDRIKEKDDLDGDLDNILFNKDGQLTISADEALKILEFNNSQQEIIDAGGSSLAKQAAEARQKYLSVIMAEFAKVNFTSNDWRKQASAASGVFKIDFTNWTKEDAQSFISNLNADNIGTADWQKSMDALAKKNGTIIDWSNKALESMLYTSFNTQIQTFVDGSEKFIEDMQDLSEKQTKGFSWKESQNLLNQLGDGSSWDQVFEINKEGIIVLKDFNATFANIYSKQISDIQSLTDELEKIDLKDGKAKSSAENIFKAFNITDESGLTDEALAKDFQAALNDEVGGAEAQTALRKKLTTEFGFSESLADSIVSWAAGTADLTSTAFIDWLKTMGEQGQALIDYLNNQQERIKQQGDYTTYFDNKYKGNQTAKNLMTSPSLESLRDYAIQHGKVSKDEAGNYDWESYFSSLSGVAIDEFGEMEITDPESFVRSIVNGEALTDAENKLLRKLLSERFSNIISTIDEFESIGTNLIVGETVDFTSVFQKDFENGVSLTVESYNSAMARLYDAAFRKGSASSRSLLKDKIMSEFNLTEIEAERWLNQAEQNYNSNIEDSLSEYYALWEKSLTSPLTLAEQTKIKEFRETEWGRDLPEFVDRTFTSYYQKIDYYVKNALENLPEPEAYNAAKVGANLFIQGKLNEQKGLNPKAVYGADLRGALNEAADSPNQIAESTVSAILAALRIAGVEMEDAYKVFNYNALTETYSYGIRDVNKLAVQLFGKSFEELDAEAQTILTNLFNSSQGSLDYNNQKILDFDELQSSINSTLGEIFSNTEELSLSQLEELYKNIYGEEAVIDTATLTKWQQIVQQARDGSTENLRILIQEWIANLPDGVEVDWNEINSYITTFAMELAQQVAGYISAGLEGSMTSSDLFELSKHLDYTPQQQDYVIGATGIQFTESGALGAATALYKKYGDLSSIGQDLLDTFGGSGGILDSWKSINDYIEEAEKNNKNVNGELDDQISALKQISHLYAISADNADFAFLDKDHFDGQAEGYMKFAESQAKAASILASIKKKERVSFDDAQALLGNLDFSKLNIQGLKDGESAITAFWAALTKTMDAAGDVDVGAALSSLGLSFTDVADQINQGTSETAAEMVEYWTGIRDMLIKYRDLDTALQGVEISLPELDFEGEKSWEEIFSGENAEFKSVVEKGLSNVQSIFDQYKIPVDASKLLEIYISAKGLDTSKLTDEGWRQVLEKDFINSLGLNAESYIHFAEGGDYTASYAMSLQAPSKAENQKAGEEAGKEMTDAAQSAADSNPPKIEPILTTATTVEQVNLLAQQISEALINSFNEAWTAMTTSSEEESTAPKIPIVADTLKAEETLEKLKQKINGSKGTVTVRAATGNAISTVNKLIADINSRTATVTVYTKNGGSLGGIGNDVDVVSGADGGDGIAKGNVALAKGRGTFMGELGPELYVQDGQYHIAGQNGPEFVDLKDDAIVFNHLQTRSILSKGHAFGRGKPLISERRSVAFATGNVGQTGPAMASGLDAAIATAEAMIGLWQGLMDQSLSDMLKGSGGHKGGGSGNSIKAVTEELQEWYNLSRQIADIEQDINNLLAERENIEWSNGEEYLKSLREQQKLLQQQMATQQALLDYQELQLKRQAKHINDNAIWSQFLTVGADGLLQYIEGNETNDGRGALQVLQELNQMSGEEQTDFLHQLGYSYTNNDGEVLEGQELVEQFFQELQDQIDQYDSLYDTVHETEETLENLRTEIEDINEQIKENQMDLEQAVFDIIVDAWEKEIEQMEEQAELIKEANEAYIDGLNDALSAERQMYDDNQKIADREQLQRQLSLLRRSGGSASEIASLEEQLNDMLKDEYFNNQERMIEDIRQANDIQVQQLETQIRLQEEALEHQKEHGVIWTQVYEVLSNSRDEILAFMQGNSTEFFSQSLLQQEQMLTDWAHKIGIYKEDQKYQNYVNHAQANLWENNQAWNLGNMSKYQSTYNSLSNSEKNTIRDQFTSVYAQARVDGKSHEQAAAEAAAEVEKTLKRKQDANNAEKHNPPVTTPNPQGSKDKDDDDGGSSGGGSSTGGTKEAVTHWAFTFNGNYKHCYRSKANAEAAINDMYNNYLNSLLREAHDREEIDQAKITADRAKKKALNTLASGKHPGYKHGGLVDFTGPAIVHGSKSRPEAFLNAEQTAQIREGLKESGKGGALEGIKAALLKLDSSIKAVTNIDNKTESNSYTIAPGAVVIQVEQLNDAYDVDTLSADIMNRMYAIGNKSTNRGVSRR